MSDHENADPEQAQAASKSCWGMKGHGGEWGWWEERSLLQKIAMGVGFAILGMGLLFLFGWVVMLLWNWLMPDIFGLKRLTYWQAWGLLILSHILFKGFGSGHGSARSDRKRRKHLRRYLHEEQEAVKENEETR